MGTEQCYQQLFFQMDAIHRDIGLGRITLKQIQRAKTKLLDALVEDGYEVQVSKGTKTSPSQRTLPVSQIPVSILVSPGERAKETAYEFANKLGISDYIGNGPCFMSYYKNPKPKSR